MSRETMAATCVILSTKCAGSTALQQAVAADPAAGHMAWLPHPEQESLFWIHAATVLGLPVWDIPDSNVPHPRTVSEGHLRKMATRNGLPEPDLSDRAGIFALWEALSAQHQVFVEKSPHHLAQRSALELMLEAAAASDRRWVFVALVRNPVDVLQSMWERWSQRPRIHEVDLLTAHANLAWLRGEWDGALVDVRYESLRSDATDLAGTLGLEGCDLDSLRDAEPKSRDSFGYRPSAEMQALIADLGYEPPPDPRSLAWPVREWTRSTARQVRVGAARTRRRLQR